MYAILLALGLALIPCAASAISYSESVDGDFSGNGLAPTPLVLAFGSNMISGSTVFGDLDYFSVSIPAQLQQIVVTNYTSANSISFIAVQSGTAVTEPPGTPDVANLLGWAHFGPGVFPPSGVGADILDNIGTGGGAQGFVPPLPSGSYAFWVQETGSSPVGYGFDFVVAPEPGSLALTALGMAALALRRATR
jgi:hypothetical protein